MHTANDFINSDGSYDVAAIMTAAHRKARAERNRTIIAYAGLRTRKGGAYSTWNAERAVLAATVDAASLNIPADRSYAAELALALADYWFRAKEIKRRGHRRAAPLEAAPVVYALAA